MMMILWCWGGKSNDLLGPSRPTLLPLGTCRPTPWPMGTLVNSRTYLDQFGLYSTCLIFPWNRCEGREDEGWGKANFRTFVQDPTDLRVSVFFLAEFSNSISALAGNVNKLQYLEDFKKRDFLSWNIDAGLIYPFFWNGIIINQCLHIFICGVKNKCDVTIVMTLVKCMFDHLCFWNFVLFRPVYKTIQIIVREG